MILAGLASALGLGVVALLVTQTAAAPQAGTTIPVTATDGGTGGPECRLRDAISAANQSALVGGCDGRGGSPFTIELQSNEHYILTVVDNPGVSGANGLPIVVNHITVHGDGATIERSYLLGNEPAFRLFQVAVTGTLSLENVKIKNGGLIYQGGGLLNLGVVEMTESNFIGNRAEDGAGVYNQGTMTVTNSTFSDNSSGCGGAISNSSSAVLTIVDSNFIANSAVT